MNIENQPWKCGTESERGTESALAGTVRVCRDVAAKFGQLRNGLIERLTGEQAQVLPDGLVERAVVEAEALAFATPYPLLFLPVLAEEKVQGARRWMERQRQILAGRQLAPVGGVGY